MDLAQNHQHRINSLQSNRKQVKKSHYGETLFLNDNAHSQNDKAARKLEKIAE